MTRVKRCVGKGSGAENGSHSGFPMVPRTQPSQPTPSRRWETTRPLLEPLASKHLEHQAQPRDLPHRPASHHPRPATHPQNAAQRAPQRAERTEQKRGLDVTPQFQIPRHAPDWPNRSSREVRKGQGLALIGNGAGWPRSHQAPACTSCTAGSGKVAGVRAGARVWAPHQSSRCAQRTQQCHSRLSSLPPQQVPLARSMALETMREIIQVPWKGLERGSPWLPPRPGPGQLVWKPFFLDLTGSRGMREPAQSRARAQGRASLGSVLRSSAPQ